MPSILSNIHTIEQHLLTLTEEPERYQPDQCPFCFGTKLWRHGVYYRQAQCEYQGQPIAIPRYLCANDDCGRTCSTLPECIAPRRWYHWAIQQMAVILLAMGYSLISGAHALCEALRVEPSISTLHRWSRRLDQQWRLHQSHLCEECSELRFQHDWKSFWRTYFDTGQRSLSQAMLSLHRVSIAIP